MVESPPFHITNAGWHDLNDLRKLEEICFDEDAWPLWDLIAILSLPKVVRLKAVVNGSMVGFIAGDPHPKEGIGWISTLGILPQYRRMGIAAALLEKCEQSLQQPSLRLSVRRSNEAALALYRRAGYQMIDVWRAYYHGGEDALVLEKRR